MRRRLQMVPILAMLIGLAAPRQGRADDLSGLRLAEITLSAINVVQRLASFTYGMLPAAPRYQPSSNPTKCPELPADVSGEPSSTQEYPDGSRSDRWVLSGSRVVTQISYPDGFREVVEREPLGPSFPHGDFSSRWFRVVHSYSTCDRLAYLRLRDLLGSLVVLSVARGTLTLADHQVVGFQLVQDRTPDVPNGPLPPPRNEPVSLADWTDVLDLDLPGGDHVQWRAPIRDKRPALDLPSRGTYTAGGQSVDFCLIRGETGYRWLLTDGRGLDGQFKVDFDFSGRGVARRRGHLEFVGKWNTRAEGTVLLADGQAVVAGPSAGAQALSNLRFSGLIVEGSAAPGL